MKVILIPILLLTSLAFAQIDPKFTDLQNCRACHDEQLADWSTTWHSRTSEDKNELFSSLLTYTSKITHKARAEVNLECAKCHNPRLSIDKIDKNYIYAKAFGLETEQTKEIDKKLHSTQTQNGISCYVCHNIDHIKDRSSLKEYGTDLFTWTKGDLIVGPYDESGRSIFHKNDHREFFEDSNTLCNSCHSGNANIGNLPGYETGEEMAGHDISCVDCHMGSKKRGYIAPQIAIENAPAKIRDIKSHLFAGARNSDILTTAISLSASENLGNIELLVQNLIPHKVPTGFSGRSIRIDIEFYSSDEKIIKKEYVNLRAKFLDRRGEEAFSYVATKLENDTRLKPLESKTLVLKKPSGAKYLRAKANYYLVAPELQGLLNLVDTTFTKAYPILETKLELN
ncbi:MAG: multiheme c-type cytochrome [Campylobacterales bacterium]|nr:multiheme c-type cytochrome [Campylobacterales bacterium]